MQHSMKPERSGPDATGGLLALAGVVVLVAAAWFVFGRPSRSGEPEIRQLMDRLDAMDKTGKQVRASSAGETWAEATGTGTAGGKPALADVDDRSRLDRLETGFSREPGDPSSATVEDQLRGVLADKRLLAAGMVPEDVEVNCRSKTCRIVADFGNADDASDWSAIYAAFLGATVVSGCQTVFVRNADGGMQARMFASRRR